MVQVAVHNRLQELYGSPSRADVERWRSVVACGQMANRSVRQPGPKRRRHQRHRTKTPDLLTTWRSTLGGKSECAAGSVLADRTAACSIQYYNKNICIAQSNLRGRAVAGRAEVVIHCGWLER